MSLSPRYTAIPFRERLTLPFREGLPFRGRLTLPIRGRLAAVVAAVMAVVAAATIVIGVLVGVQRPLPTAADALKVALSQVGTTEDAAGGSKFNQWFMSSPYARAGVERDGGSVGDYANASWCDMFVTWVGDKAGVKGMGGDAFTPSHARWFKDQGRWGTVPKPGAVVFFSWSGGGIGDIDHVGLVIRDNHDGTIRTVEGNTDDAVKIRTRGTDSVVGYGYPDYGH
ncbi:CHAP domain-containing protein [Actinoallomurus sp. NBC_01490]|uniref:CHAP domain-containing protein n=1 Tax=Actinoallomurus sp. NBC_01490 TaxID=2903557 RepID=UPI002E314AAA|nr:CHAP domain-containing protein [Actinoallomurus sp. NBC_01490]